MPVSEITEEVTLLAQLVIEAYEQGKDRGGLELIRDIDELQNVVAADYESSPPVGVCGVTGCGCEPSADDSGYYAEFNFVDGVDDTLEYSPDEDSLFLEVLGERVLDLESMALGDRVSDLELNLARLEQKRVRKVK